MTNNEKIAVLQAAEAGKPLEHHLKGSPQPWGMCHNPIWDFSTFDYRISPEPPPLPKAREWWLVSYPETTTGPWKSVESAINHATMGGRVVPVREVLPNEGWVAFKERQPTPQQQILIFYATGEVRQIKWQSHGFGGWYSNERPTHWQPMIPLPKV